MSRNPDKRDKERTALNKGKGKRTLIALGVIVLGALFAFMGLSALRGHVGRYQEELMQELRERSVRLQPVVDAIESYREQHGEYPENLSDLSLDMPEDFFADGRGGQLVYVKEWQELPYVLSWNHSEFLSNRLLAYTAGDAELLRHSSNSYVLRLETLPNGWTIWRDLDGSGGCGPGGC